MAPQSDHVVDHLTIGSRLKIVSKLDLRKFSERIDVADPVSQTLPKTAIQLPTCEPRSALAVLSAPPDDNANCNTLPSDLDFGVGRALVPEKRDCAPDSRLIPLALTSTILVATCGWLWFLFQVGRWLLGF